MKPHELIAALMAREGLGPLPLAKKMGKPRLQPQIQRFWRGEVDEPEMTTARPLANYFKIPIEAIYEEGVATKVARERNLTVVALPEKRTRAAKEPDWLQKVRAMANDVPPAVSADIGVFVGQLVELFTQMTPDQRDDLLIFANNLANIGKTKPSVQDPFAGKKPRRKQEPMLIRELHRADDHLIKWLPADMVKGAKK